MSESKLVTRNIFDLNEYILVKIFELCSLNDLENLYITCRPFQYVIENVIFKKRSMKLLMTGHYGNNEVYCNNRTFNNLSFRERMHISSNWINGRYKEYVFFRHRKFFVSKLRLEKEWFYMSNAGYIRIYKRTSAEEPLQRNYIKEIAISDKSDISDFVKKGEKLFACGTYGNCLFYENDNITEQKLHTTKEYLTCVDFVGNYFVTCSDKTSKLWNKSVELGFISFNLISNYKNPYKCMKISDDAAKIYGGMYTDMNRRALREIDVETGFQKTLNSNTLSIYDLKIKDNNILLTAHFDTTFRMFDKRTNRDESIWTDPYDSSIYCLEYDDLFGIVCGMKYHNRVNLYDIRVPKKFIQMYFPTVHRTYGSPIYSVVCDSQYLFVSTDRDIRVLDFNADWAPSKDFRNIFVNI